MITPAGERIFLNPPKFWAHTRNMNEEDAEQFASKILRLAAEGRVEELRRYDFIFFGHTKRPFASKDLGKSA